MSFLRRMVSAGCGSAWRRPDADAVHRIGFFRRPRILLVSACPSTLRLWPLSSCRVDVGDQRAGGAERRVLAREARAAQHVGTWRSISRSPTPGSSSSGRPRVERALCTEARACSWRRRRTPLVGHGDSHFTCLARNRPPRAISIRAHGAMRRYSLTPLPRASWITSRLTGSRMITARRSCAARRGVDPVALPARGAQLRVDLVGVVTALAGDDRSMSPGRRRPSRP